MLPQLSLYPVNLHILSPIHIGTGQELDPFSYIIRDKTLFLIDLVKWMETYPDQDKLYKMTDSDNFASVRSFIADNFDLETAIQAAIPLDNPKLADTYHKAVRDKNPRNQVLISPMIRNEVSMEAYIPGSSVKGAIRTAIASYFVEAAGVTSKDDRGRFDYNQKIFGGIKDDPMRFLKLSDVSLGKSGTVIVEAVEYPLNPDKSLTPKGHMEVSLSQCHTGKPFVFPLRFSMAQFELHKTKINPEFVIDSLYRFYVPKYEEEYKKFFQSQRAGRIQQGIVSMNKAVADLRTNETLIRIGHFSHVECITLDTVRNPRTRLGKDRKPLPWGKTRTLANGYFPFGWAKLEFPDIESKPRQDRQWPFLLKADPGQKDFQAGFDAEEKPEPVFEKKKPDTGNIKSVPRVTLSPLEKIMNELGVIKPDDMGRIGTIVQKIETLETDIEKGVLAKAIKDKIGSKKFKKYKQKQYLLELIAKADKS